MANLNNSTYFNKLWLDSKIHPEFSSWVDSVTSNPSSAFCKVCSKTIKLSNMGKQALVSHSKEPKHLKNLSSKSQQPSISFFTKKTFPNPVGEGSKESSSEVLVSSNNVQTSTVLHQKEIKTFVVNEDDITSAEIIWALQVVSSNMSLNSCDGSSVAFRRMFPDSNIAQKFTMGKTKASYVLNHGLAPYFQDYLKRDLTNCQDFVVCFDESLNKIAQRCQMDLVVRFWDINQQKVSTRYWTSVFLGRSTADHLLENFSKGLPEENILQVSMDGPNVNLSFLKKLENSIKIENPEGKLFLDIGICGLHSVNGAMKTAFVKSNWDVSDVLKAMYHLFKNSPARRAKYTEITGSKNFPMKFTSIRWLENSCYVEQALKICNHVLKFINTESVPGNKNFELIKKAMSDSLLKAKLSAFKSNSAEVEPFFKRFQSQKPLVPFLYSSLEHLVKNLLARVVKQETLLQANTVQKLLNLDLEDLSNLLPVEKVNIGFGAKSILKEVKNKEKDKLLFKRDLQKIIISIVNKLKDKSPLKSQLPRGLTCFDPKIIIHNPSLGLQRIEVVLEYFHGSRRIFESVAENAKKQYLKLTEEINADEQWKKKVLDYIEEGNDKVGLDELYYSIIGNNKSYQDLWDVTKLSLILSHGNASVESGFSLNKHLLVDNLLEESLVAQRVVLDAIKNAGSTDNILITRSMLSSVRGSRKKYQIYLEKKKETITEEERKQSEKRKISFQLKELEEKRKKLEYKREKEDLEIVTEKKLLEQLKKTY